MADYLELVGLTQLMERTRGRPEIFVGLIDGPVATGHSDLTGANIREIAGKNGRYDQASSAACFHGTYIAGVLCAKRGSISPAICPDCTILVRPIFAEGEEGRDHKPSATPEKLVQAILDCIEAGARVLNLSVAHSQTPTWEPNFRQGSTLDAQAKLGLPGPFASA